MANLNRTGSTGKMRTPGKATTLIIPVPEHNCDEHYDCDGHERQSKEAEKEEAAAAARIRNAVLASR